MAKKETAVATVNKDFILPEVSGDLQSIIAEELDGLTLTFDRIKVPSGGSLAFEVTDENGESDIRKEISGIIVGHSPENVFYMTKYTGGNEMPDCVAANGKIGVGNPGGICGDCPYNAWGSAENGVGKACQNRHKVFILQDGELFPIMLSLPVTSVKNFTEYVKRAVIKGKRTSAFITKVSLAKEKSADGIEYSKCVFTKDADLSPEKAAQAYSYSLSIKEMIGKTSSELIPKEQEWESEGDEQEAF